MKTINKISLIAAMGIALSLGSCKKSETTTTETTVESTDTAKVMEPDTTSTKTAPADTTATDTTASKMK